MSNKGIFGIFPLPWQWKNRNIKKTPEYPSIKLEDIPKEDIEAEETCPKIGGVFLMGQALDVLYGKKPQEKK